MLRSNGNESLIIEHVLFIFLDGIGLGDAEPTGNPFVVAEMPLLNELAGGQWLRGQSNFSAQASFVPVDPRLGVAGRPQSATGQATILTGRNVPAEIGEDDGFSLDETEQVVEEPRAREPRKRIRRAHGEDGERRRKRLVRKLSDIELPCCGVVSAEME